MEAGDTPTPTSPPGGDPLSGEEIRRATFPQALRGYDRQAVHDLLDRVADWMEGAAGSVSSAAPGMREELAKVGERTAGILTAAEEAAQNLRDEAVEYAERLRADAEDESRKARLNASQKMDEMVAEAEQKAQTIIDDAIARRRQLNQAISSLIDRRDEIAADATRLAEELLSAVEDLGSRDSAEEDPELDMPADEPSAGTGSDASPSAGTGSDAAEADEPAEDEVPVPTDAALPPADEAEEPGPQGPPTLLVDPDPDTDVHAVQDVPPHPRRD